MANAAIATVETSSMTTIVKAFIFTISGFYECKNIIFVIPRINRQELILLVSAGFER